MQIVIDIPEELYKDIKEHGLCGYCSDREIVSDAISNGTVLPKGHSDLVDIDAIYDHGNSKGFCDWYDELEIADVVIEADKAESEG